MDHRAAPSKSSGWGVPWSIGASDNDRVGRVENRFYGTWHDEGMPAWRIVVCGHDELEDRCREPSARLMSAAASSSVRPPYSVMMIGCVLPASRAAISSSCVGGASTDCGSIF